MNSLLRRLQQLLSSPRHPSRVEAIVPSNLSQNLCLKVATDQRSREKRMELSGP